jgi:hypothetical protein
VSGKSYHEITGGSLIGRLFSRPNQTIYLNQSDFEFDPACNVTLER